MSSPPRLSDLISRPLTVPEVSEESCIHPSIHPSPSMHCGLCRHRAGCLRCKTTNRCPLQGDLSLVGDKTTVLQDEVLSQSEWGAGEGFLEA